MSMEQTSQPAASAQRPFAAELDVAIATARAAAEVIAEYYDAHTAATYEKGDGTPVTDADLAADRVIRDRLAAAFPKDALLTEEGSDDLARMAEERCWIVDPLDGTAQFVAGTGNFDVMIALVIDRRPVVAVTCHPPTGDCLAAVRGQGAFRLVGTDRSPVRITPLPPDAPPRIRVSRWYGAQQFTGQIAAIGRQLGGLVPPVADVGFAPRDFFAAPTPFDIFLGLTPVDAKKVAQEWDIAAPDLIVHEAGGVFTDLWGRLPRYNKRDTSISGGLLVACDPATHVRALAAVHAALDLPATPPPLDLAEAAPSPGLSPNAGRGA